MLASGTRDFLLELFMDSPDTFQILVSSGAHDFSSELFMTLQEKDETKRWRQEDDEFKAIVTVKTS